MIRKVACVAAIVAFLFSGLFLTGLLDLIWRAIMAVFVAILIGLGVKWLIRRVAEAIAEHRELPALSEEERQRLAQRSAEWRERP